MAYPGARILLLDEQGTRPTAYQETEHYRLTKMFMEDPDRTIDRLFR